MNNSEDIWNVYVKHFQRYVMIDEPLFRISSYIIFYKLLLLAGIEAKKYNDYQILEKLNILQKTVETLYQLAQEKRNYEQATENY